MIFDKGGHLYGTTQYGGNYSACSGGCGVVFELEHGGTLWTESLLYTFQGSGDGGTPYAGLVFDGSGALYGTTSSGGALEDGAVFKLTPPTVQGNPWTESVLYSFQGFNDTPPDGYSPAAGVIFDGKNLFGTNGHSY